MEGTTYHPYKYKNKGNAMAGKIRSEACRMIGLSNSIIENSQVLQAQKIIQVSSQTRLNLQNEKYFQPWMEGCLRDTGQDR